MASTHALASGMGGMRTAGDLVARMQMTRGMRLPQAKQYVADKLGCSVLDLSDTSRCTTSAATSGSDASRCRT